MTCIGFKLQRDHRIQLSFCTSWLSEKGLKKTHKRILWVTPLMFELLLKKNIYCLLLRYIVNYFVLFSWLHTEFPVVLAHCMLIRTIAFTFIEKQGCSLVGGWGTERKGSWAASAWLGNRHGRIGQFTMKGLFAVIKYWIQQQWNVCTLFSVTK